MSERPSPVPSVDRLPEVDTTTMREVDVAHVARVDTR